MAQEDKPAPMVASDIDLRGYDFMPLYGDRLFHSETWIESKPEARCAALRLWYHAFTKEVPPASLPDRDSLLANYAGYGDQIASWKRVRPQALRGWILCSDGRLYHEVLATIALEAWERRTESRIAQDRLTRHRAERSNLFAFLADRGVHLPFNAPIATLRETAVPLGWNVSSNGLATARSEGKRSEAKLSEVQNRDLALPLSTPPILAVASVNGAVSKAPDPKGATTTIGQNWKSLEWVTATAKELGVSRHGGEAWDGFRDRVYDAVRRRRTGGNA